MNKPRRSAKTRPPAATQPAPDATGGRELVIITGLSGSGKGSVLKVFEDMGFYAVDNLPIDLIPTFADLCRHSADILRAALVVDIREGEALRKFPKIFQQLRKQGLVFLLFLEAGDAVLQRRFSETRRPHPLSGRRSVLGSIRAERKALQPIEMLADLILDTSKFNIHELRRLIVARFRGGREDPPLLIAINSFGFKHGVPSESDLVFDVRFLPNPNYAPGCKTLTGRHPKVIRYILSFPQTGEFIGRISDLLLYLIPHYVREGKSYLTIGFGCTGGRHRSVMIAEAVGRNLENAGSEVKVSHRDIEKA
ncbi:MAG TPA: RNase adapter RapZ [Bryobacterales bacterium]|nr:RNase adapter RapZ [Bryobacterales bacterium]